MATIHIRHQVNNDQIMGCFCQPLNTSLTHAIRKALKPNEKLTAEKAIKTLRGIEIKSKIESFFTKPVVAITLTLGVTVGGYIASAFAAFSLAIAILGLTFAVSGTLAFGIIVRSACNGSLHKMSEAYAERAHTAEKYIQEIKAALRAGHEVRIVLG